MKKIMKKAGLWAGTVGVVIAGAATFSAFEAHIINVTARIENALAVQTGAIDFGTVFPQEFLEAALPVTMSESFLGEDRVDDIEYVIKQKPKVKLFDGEVADPNENPTPGDPYATIFPTTHPEGIVAWRYCEENLPLNAPYSVTEANMGDEYWRYCYLPLANYLSKHETTADGSVTENDISVDAFHQSYMWNASTSQSSLDPAFIARGRLAKSEQDTEDAWTIDLMVPCFINHCAQEADDPNNLPEDQIPGFFVPGPFRLPTSTEHSVFGTDLWIEVSGISLPPTDVPGTLTVTKVLVNDNDGTATTTDFSFAVNGGASAPFEADGTNVIALPAGNYDVVEDAAAGYTTTYANSLNASLDCQDLVVPSGGNVTCTITNDDTAPPAPEVGELTVIKVVVNDNGGTAVTGDFSLFVDAAAVVSGVSTTTAVGSHTVSEAGLFGYSATFSGDCNASGIVEVSSSTPATCTITNDDIAPTITVTKNVVGGTASPDDFDPSVDGAVVTSGSSTVVSANVAHAIDEEASVAGYTFTSITGVSFLGVPCPAALNGTITLTPGDVVTCTITNTSAPSLATTH